MTKIDGNSSETYDQLVSERKDVADVITQINTRISTYKLLLSDLMKVNDSDPAKNAQQEESLIENAAEETVEMSKSEIDAIVQAVENASAQKLAVLEKDIETLVEKRKTIMVDFSSILNAYNAEKINDMTVEIIQGRVYSPSLLSGSFIMSAIKTAGPICTVGFMVCMVMLIISRRKEQKAK